MKTTNAHLVKQNTLLNSILTNFVTSHRALFKQQATLLETQREMLDMQSTLLRYHTQQGEFEFFRPLSTGSEDEEDGPEDSEHKTTTKVKEDPDIIDISSDHEESGSGEPIQKKRKTAKK